MNKVLTIKDKIVLAPLWLITLLPLRVLYILSDFFFVLLFYIVRYRKEVVLENLKNSFPDKSHDELKQIRREFFHFLTDYFVESIYVMNISLKEINRRYRFENVDLLKELNAKGKDVILATSHYGNWDWAINLPVVFSEYAILAIYKPLSNKVFDRLFIYLRSKFGAIPIPMKSIFRELSTARLDDQRVALYTVADQRPVREDLNFWMNFLNQDTPVITGWERIARKFNYAVVFFDVERVKRGNYVAKLKLLAEDSSAFAANKLVEAYMKELEKLVHREPALYLWSHKRWKYKPEEFKPKQ